MIQPTLAVVRACRTVVYRDHYGSNTTRHCEAFGCGKPTREAKPWCIDHVLSHSPYARQVAKAWAAREERVGPGSILYGDALAHLRMLGAMTVPYLARQLSTPHPIASAVSRALVRERAVTLDRNKRGVIVLELVA